MMQEVFFMLSERYGPQKVSHASTRTMTRRRFLEQSLVVGAGAGAALTLLDACDMGTRSTTGLTYWNLFGGGDGVRMVQMENDFSKSHPNVQLESVTLAWGAPYYTKLAMA